MVALLLCILLFRQQKIPSAAIATAATAPTIAPTIVPVLLLPVESVD